MERSVPLVVGETYHVYNRGAHKQNIFTCEADYNRFQLLLYIANQSQSVNLRDLISSKKYKGESFVKMFEEERLENLVDIFAYSLMPNHFHMVVRPKKEGGLSEFMRKLLTAYSMYFNTKYDHSGVLFQGPFKSKHIDNESYFRYIFAYTHLNALDLFETGWKEEKVKDLLGARTFMKNYPYSSFFDYSVGGRPEGRILSRDSTPDFLTTQNDLEELLGSFTKESPL